MNNFDFISFSANLLIAGALFAIAVLLLLIFVKLTSDKKSSHKSR